MQPSNIQDICPTRNGHHSGSSDVPNTTGVQSSGQVGRDIGSENTTDPVTRQRDQNGSTRNRRFAYDEPLADGVRMRDTPLVGLLEELSRSSKAAASYIEWFYDHVLQNERNQLLLLRALEEAKHQAAADRAEAHNAEIEAKKDQAREAAEADLEGNRAKISAVEELLHGAHAGTAMPAAIAGGVYDPEHPEAACLRHSPQPLGVVIGRSRLPWVEGEAQVHLPAWLAWVVTVLVGAMIGVSVGMLCHSLHADSLDRTPGMTLAFVAVGFAVAVGFKYAARYAWFLVGQYVYSQVRAFRWLPSTLIAVLITGIIVAADAMTNLQGLLAMASQDAGINGLPDGSSHTASLPLAMYLVSLVVSAGFVACASYEGYLRGRHFEVHNRALALQYDEFAIRDSQVRSDPKTIAALIRANEARVLMHYKTTLEAAAAQRESRRDRAVSELDSRSLPDSTELSDKAAPRIQDQRHNFLGAMRVFNHLLYCAFPRIFRRRWWG